VPDAAIAIPATTEEQLLFAVLEQQTAAIISRTNRRFQNHPLVAHPISRKHAQI
jgi:hypothetical protein